ncbi:PREDICTED: olfactory receptor 12-like [Thamnophis sirtalis]|uniref:Olfactory receptor n=1 Tax=Thamnophis sirtalis TaxID=35019 RepID=A0A6I9Y699_9SAUR|nr:PREDICTED: olfactory receptor 12-like [Thamnophis sirtalis]
MGNHSKITQFVLEGFSGPQELQLGLFFLFMLLYIVTLIWNIGMITIIILDPQLQSPMYFFLKNLSFLDICYSSVITPRAMVSFATGQKGIFYNACAIQMFFFSLFGTTECFILAVMAYDRFTAICNPLLYNIIMSRKTCILQIAACYFFGFINCCTQTSLTFSLSYCEPREINQFFCDVPAVMKAACSDTFVNEIVLLALCGFIIVITSTIVLISYVYIVATILHMASAERRHKAFSTCASHIMAVTLFFGTAFFMYGQPGAMASPNQGKVVSIFYTVVIPMLNPLIYSLRNKEVKYALGRQLKKVTFFK